MGKPKFIERSDNSSLILENLPWISDRESQVRVKEYTVVHKDDPFEWYRPVKVKIDKKTVWTIKRYLNDQDQYTQYTQDDMLVKLGHNPAPWPRFFSSYWWKDNGRPKENKRVNKEYSGHDVPVPSPLLSPIPLERTDKDALRSYQHVCEKYKKVICSTEEPWDEDTSPFVALMRSGD